MEVTGDDLRTCTFEPMIFLDFAGGGWTQVHQCVEQPRLARIYRVRHRGATAEEVFEVDGREFGIDELERVAAALNAGGFGDRDSGDSDVP